MVGFVMLEIQGAYDFPWLANSMCFSFRSSFQPFIFFQRLARDGT